jgi:hypothetical protein
MRRTITKMHSIGIMAILVLSSSLSIAQTVLVNPSAEGGFELGSTFADNGWTVENGAVVNQWNLGTVPVGFTNNSAYISNDAGATNAYSNNSASVSHFYRDVTFPAGEIAMQLSFNWMALGEVGFWDAIIVSIAPTSYTPVASTTSLGTGVLPAPAIEVGRLWSSGTAQFATFNLPPSVIGNCSTSATWRVIFTWKNDGSGGSNPAGVIDNVSLVSASSPITTAGGNFTIDNTLPTAGTNFQSFTEAIAALNAANSCGPFVSPVIFNVTAGQTFSELPPVITATGSAGIGITFQKSGAGSNPVILPTGTAGTNDGAIVISGGDYFTFDGIDINASAVTNMEYGYILRSLTATNGAQFNTIKNCSVTMNRNNTTTTSSAILQSASTTGGGVTPSSAAGANSNNAYLNITVSQATNGIYLNGNGTNRDLNTIVGSDDCTIRNTFSDLGPLALTFTASRAIWALNQENLQLFNNDIDGVAGNQSVTAAILATGLNGNSAVYNNNITNVSVFGSASTTSAAQGMNIALNTTGTHNVRIYNNTVSNIYTSFTGSATATRYAIGILVGTAASTSTYDVDNNSVSIGFGLTPTYSNTCFQTGGSAAIYNVRGNIFANFTGAQTAPARHTVYATTSATAFAAASSITAYNDLYVQNDLGTSGFTAVTNTTTRTTITDFSAAMTPAGLETGSISADPLFVNNLNDVHAQAIETNAVAGFTPAAWILTDMDCELRSSFTPSDLGADAYDVQFCAGTPDPSTTLSSVPTVCPSINFGLSLGTTYSGVGFTYQWQSSSDDVSYSNISGATNSTLNTFLVSDTYYQCIITCTVSGFSTTSSPVLVTTNSFINCYCANNATNPADTDIGNVTFGTLNNGVGTPILNNPTATGTYSDFTSLAAEDFELGTTYPLSISQITSGGTFYGAQANVFIDFNQDGVFDNTTERVFTGATSSTGPISTLSGSVIIPVTAALGTTRMRVILQEGGTSSSPSCGTYGYGETEDYLINIICPNLAAPTGTGTSICAGNTATIGATATIGTISWFDDAVAGTNVGTGNSYTTPVLVSTTSYYAQADFAGCPSGPRTEVVISVDPVNAVLNPVDVTCNGGNNGSFTLGTVTCGVLPFTYSVNGGAFDEIPSNLTAGTYSVIIEDAGGFQSAPQNIIINEPSWTINNPVGTSAAICLNDANVEVIASANTTIENVGSTVVSFDLLSQPAEVNAAPGNIISTGTMSALPAGSVVTSATLTFNGIEALGGSWQSDVRLGLSGSVANAAAAGTGALNGNGLFNYTRTIPAASVNVAGGTVNLLYWDAFNDVTTGPDATFPTGLGVATLTVNYTFPTPSTIQWFDAASAGTLLGTGSPFETVGTTVLPNTTTAGTYNFYAEASYLGCTSPSRTLVTVTINPLPTVEAGLDQTVCAGTAVTLSGSGASTYSWNNGVVNGVAFIPSATQSYTVTGTDVNGCVNTSFVTVTVNDLPAVDAGLDVEVCENGSVTLTATSTESITWTGGVVNGVAFVPVATATYTASVIDGNGCSNSDQVTVTVNALPAVNGGADQEICDGTSITLSGSGADTYVWTNSVTNGIAFIPSSTATYTVTGTDINGCINSDDVTITVNPLPIVNAGTDITVCAGTTVNLVGSGATTYSWNNGITDGVDFIPTATVTYTVTGTDDNGCENTDAVVVFVNDLPTVNAGADLTVCQNGQAILSATGALTYSWDNGVTNNIPFVVPATATYTVVGTDANGCTNTDDVIVTATPLPSVEAGANITQCGDQSVTLSGSGATVYSWNNGVVDGVAFNAPFGTTSYIVTGVDAFGCSNTDIVTVTIGQNPNATATYADPLTLISTNTGVFYQWINCADNTPIAGATSSTFNVTDNGTYAVVVTTQEGCVDTSACLIIDYVKVEELTNNYVTLYPNPTRDNVTIKMTQETAIVEIVDAQGKVVKSTRMDNGESLSLIDFEPGIYIFKVTTDVETTIHRITKN